MVQNSFRNRGKDTLIVFLLFSLITLPYIIKAAGMFSDESGRIPSGILLALTFIAWNLFLSSLITAVLYTKYFVALDHGIVIHENKTGRIFAVVACIGLYGAFCWLLFSQNDILWHNTSLLPANVIVISFRRVVWHPVVIGETYITDTYKTIRIDAIASVERSNESLTEKSLITIKLKDGKEMILYGFVQMYDLIREKAGLNIS